MRRRGTGFSGSITVFLCLMLVCILGFTGACLEYARAQTVSCQVQLAADSAAESIFAGYHDPLFSRYQILGRLIPSGNFEALEKETLRYASSYGEKNSVLDAANIAAFSTESADWSQVTYLTDQNGRVFTNMAAKSMTVSGASVVVSQWKSRLGLSDSETSQVLQENSDKETWNMSDLLNGYDDWSDSVEDAEKSAAEAAKAAEAAAAGNGTTGNSGNSNGSIAGTAGSTQTAGSSGTGAASGNTSGTSDTAGPTKEGTKILNMVETVRTLLKNGVLSLVLPKGAKVSSGTISTSGLPSGLSSSQKSRSVGQSISGGNTLLFHEYLTRHMDCFTVESDKSVAYELEYLVAGKSSDQDNLKAAVTRMLWIRIGLNLAYLNKSAAKKAEAKEAATLAVGWTAQPALVIATQELLLSAWAAAESIVDVRTLLSGKKVPLMKTDADWNLELNKLADAGKNQTLGNQSSDTGGLSYVDYLRICMYMTSDTKLAYRAMDVIQWNIQKMDSTFAMSHCMVAGEMTLTASSEPVFAVLYRGVGRMGSASGASVRKQSSYSYTGT